MPSADVQSTRKMVDLMDETSQEIVRSKRESKLASHEQVGGGKDIMSILRTFTSSIHKDLEAKDTHVMISDSQS